MKKKRIKWSKISEHEKKREEAWQVWKNREDKRRIKNINYHTRERDKKTGRLIERKREREREIKGEKKRERKTEDRLTNRQWDRQIKGARNQEGEGEQ